MTEGAALIVSALVSCGLSATLAWWCCRPGSFLNILDYPNERSLHRRPTPRSGGVAIVAASFFVGLVTALFFEEQLQQLFWIGVAALALAITSFVDDRWGLRVQHRLVVHVGVAIALLMSDFSIPAIFLPGENLAISPFTADALTLFFIVWMVNLYNFMDGMDGFGGGMAVIGFGTYAILGLMNHEILFAAMNLIVAAAALGFLFFNFPPAKLFMGDTGSATLGLLAAASALWGATVGVFGFWIGLLVFSPFIVDASVTLCRRIFRREKIWLAHKTHYYQRLVQLGWGHRRTVVCEYLVMLGCALTAIVASRASVAVQWLIMGFWGCAYIAMARAVTYLERKRIVMRTTEVK